MRASTCGGFGLPMAARSNRPRQAHPKKRTLPGAQLAKGRDMRAFARQSCGPPMATPSNRSVRPAAEQRRHRTSRREAALRQGAAAICTHYRAPFGTQLAKHTHTQELRPADGRAIECSLTDTRRFADGGRRQEQPRATCRPPRGAAANSTRLQRDLFWGRSRAERPAAPQTT